MRGRTVGDALVVGLLLAFALAWVVMGGWVMSKSGDSTEDPGVVGASFIFLVWFGPPIWAGKMIHHVLDVE